MSAISTFKGINNASDPLRLGLGWLAKADNVDVTDTGALERRPGYVQVASGSFSGVYATRQQDFERLYVVNAGALKQVHPDLTMTTLREGLSNAPMHWTEINSDTYFSNGIDKGIIRPDGSIIAWDWPLPDAPTVRQAGGTLAQGEYGVCCTFSLPDGRETGASDAVYLEASGGLLVDDLPQAPGCLTNLYIAPAGSTVFQLALTTGQRAVTWNAGPDALGMDLVTQGFEPPPASASLPVLWAGRAWLAEHFPAQDISVLWPSEPLGFHLFARQTGFVPVPGRIVMVLAHDAGLIVGTRTALYAWNGEALTQLAGYGAVEGWPGTRDEETGACYFWTERGLCQGLPFKNLTAAKLRMDPGTQACAAIVHQDGGKKIIVATVPGGRIFNPRSTS